MRNLFNVSPQYSNRVALAISSSDCLALVLSLPPSFPMLAMHASESCIQCLYTNGYFVFLKKHNEFDHNYVNHVTIDDAGISREHGVERKD